MKKLLGHPIQRIGEWVMLGVGLFIAHGAIASWPFWASDTDVVIGELFCEAGTGRFDAGTCTIQGESFDLSFLGIPEHRLREISFLQARVTVLRTHQRASMLNDELLAIDINGEQIVAPSRAYAVRAFETFSIGLMSAFFFFFAVASLRRERTLLETIKFRIQEDRAKTKDRP